MSVQGVNLRGRGAISWLQTILRENLDHPNIQHVELRTVVTSLAHEEMASATNETHHEFETMLKELPPPNTLHEREVDTDGLDEYPVRCFDVVATDDGSS